MEDLEMIISPDTKRKERIPPGQYQTQDWPVLHYGGVPKVHTAKWSLRLFGLVDKERTLRYAEFTALPQIKVFSDIHCVTTWSRLNNLWEGVGVSQLKNLVNISNAARFVIIHAANNFSTNLALSDFFETDVILATKHNRDPISNDHGGPVRLVVPRLYFWKSAKWITGIEFSTDDHPGFWEKAGYHNHGDPWTEERYGRGR
jgi:DMSO/TMAO reductase YedYZ molybdopterin-dependent catalytic subunit